MNLGEEEPCVLEPVEPEGVVPVAPVAEAWPDDPVPEGEEPAMTYVSKRFRGDGEREEGADEV